MSSEFPPWNLFFFQHMKRCGAFRVSEHSKKAKTASRHDPTAVFQRMHRFLQSTLWSKSTLSKIRHFFGRLNKAPSRTSQSIRRNLSPISTKTPTSMFPIVSHPRTALQNLPRVHPPLVVTNVFRKLNFHVPPYLSAVISCISCCRHYLSD